MVNYQNSKIYKITDNAYNKCYIGSTCESLSKRMSKHRDHYNRWKNGTHHKVTVHDIFDEYGIENCKIELIENYPCLSKEELHRREGNIIKATDCVNKAIPGRKNREYRQDNKATLTKQSKQYYKNNKETIKERQKQYYESNKEKILEKAKQKYEKNKDSVKPR